MRIHNAILVTLLGVIMSASGDGVAAEVTSGSGNADSTTSFLEAFGGAADPKTKAIAKLRGAAGGMAKLEEATNFHEPVSELSLPERANLVEHLFDQVQAMQYEFSHIDWSALDVPEGLEAIMQQSENATRAATKAMADAIQLMRGADSEKKPLLDDGDSTGHRQHLVQGVDSSGGRGLPTSKRHRRTQEKDHPDGASTSMEVMDRKKRQQRHHQGTATHKDRDQSSSFFQQEEESSRHRRTTSSNPFTRPRHQQPLNHVHRHVLEMQDAAMNGDHSYVDKMLKRLHKSQFATPKQKSADQGHRHLTKAELCTQLTECASAMSLYDLFVYFYSDDSKYNPEGILLKAR